MKKMGKKGFMMAEVVVVSVVVATVLVTLFVGLSRVSSAYELRNRYYDIDALYLSMEANDLLLSHNYGSRFKVNNPQELANNACDSCRYDCELAFESCYNNCNSEDYDCYYDCEDANYNCYMNCNSSNSDCGAEENFDSSSLYLLKNKNNNNDIKFYYSPYDKDSILSLKNLNGINETFKDYIDYLGDSFDYNESITTQSFDCKNYIKYYKEPPGIPEPMNYGNSNKIGVDLLVDGLNMNNGTAGRLLETNDYDYSDLFSDNFYIYVLITEMCDKKDENNCKYYGLKVGRTRFCANVEREP